MTILEQLSKEFHLRLYAVGRSVYNETDDAQAAEVALMSMLQDDGWAEGFSLEAAELIVEKAIRHIEEEQAAIENDAACAATEAEDTRLDRQEELKRAISARFDDVPYGC